MYLVLTLRNRELRSSTLLSINGARAGSAPKKKKESIGHISALARTRILYRTCFIPRRTESQKSNIYTYTPTFLRVCTKRHIRRRQAPCARIARSATTTREKKGGEWDKLVNLYPGRLRGMRRRSEEGGKHSSAPRRSRRWRWRRRRESPKISARRLLSLSLSLLPRGSPRQLVSRRARRRSCFLALVKYSLTYIHITYAYTNPQSCTSPRARVSSVFVLIKPISAQQF